jgi:hypothetical protein
MLTLSSPMIRGCTIVENTGLVAGGVLSTWDSAPSVSNSIIAFNNGEVGVYCEPGLVMACCDVFGNAGQDWGGCLEGQDGANGNFEADPLFCGLEEGDLTLRSDSPCAGENNPVCGQIGAWGVGCENPTSIERASWGHLKHLFR